MARLESIRGFARRQRLIGAILLPAVLMLVGGVMAYLYDQTQAFHVLSKLNAELKQEAHSFHDRVLLAQQLSREDRKGMGNGNTARPPPAGRSRFFLIQLGKEYRMTEFGEDGRALHYVCSESGSCWVLPEGAESTADASSFLRPPDLEVGRFRDTAWYRGISQEPSPAQEGGERYWEGFSIESPEVIRWTSALAPAGIREGSPIMVLEAMAAPVDGTPMGDSAYLVFEQAPSSAGISLDADFSKYSYAQWRSEPEKNFGLRRVAWSGGSVWRHIEAVVLPSGQEVVLVTARIAAYPAQWSFLLATAVLGMLFGLPLALLLPSRRAKRAEEALLAIAARVARGNTSATLDKHWSAPVFSEIASIQTALDRAAEEQAAMIALSAAHAAAEDATADEAMTAPPAAFMQALHLARRQAREAEEEAQALRAQLEAIQGTRPADIVEEPIARLRDAIGRLALSPEPPAVETEEALRQLTACVADTLGAEACSVWLWDNARGTLNCLDRHVREGQRHQSGLVLQRAAMPGFLTALGRAACIASGDVASDPRVTQLLPAWQKAAEDERRFILDEPPSALLVAPIRMGGLLIGMVLVEHRGELRPWTPSEEAFLLAVAQLAGRRLPPLIGVEADEGAQEAKEGALEEFERRPPESASPMSYFADGDGAAWRQLVSSSGVALLTVDLREQIAYANHAAERTYRTVPGALAGRDFCALSTGQGEAEHQAMRRVVQQGVMERISVEHRRADGQPFRIEYLLTPLQNEQGHIIGVVACGLDRTDEEMRQAEALEQATPYRRFADTVNGVLWRADAIGCIRYVNAASAPIYGYTPAELIGRPLSILGGEENGGRDLERFSRLVEGRPCRGYRTQHRRKDGGVFWVLVYAATECDAEGRVIGAAGIAVPVPEEA